MVSILDPICLTADCVCRVTAALIAGLSASTLALTCAATSLFMRGPAEAFVASIAASSTVFRIVGVWNCSFRVVRISPCIRAISAFVSWSASDRIVCLISSRLLHPTNAGPMSTSDQPSEEELRAAYEAEIKKISVEQIVLEQVVSLVNLGMRRTGLSPGTENERDAGQVRTAIEAGR